MRHWPLKTSCLIISVLIHWLIALFFSSRPIQDQQLNQQASILLAFESSSIASDAPASINNFTDTEQKTNPKNESASQKIEEPKLKRQSNHPHSEHQSKQVPKPRSMKPKIVPVQKAKKQMHQPKPELQSKLKISDQENKIASYTKNIFSNQVQEKLTLKGSQPSEKAKSSSQIFKPSHPVNQMAVTLPNALIKVFAESIARLKKYPRRARMLRQQGAVQLAFALNQQGQVIDVNLLNTSGYSALDQAAVQLLNQIKVQDKLARHYLQHQYKIQIIYKI